MRTSIIAALFFFALALALAPAAFAASTCYNQDGQLTACPQSQTTGANTSQAQTTGVNTGQNTTLINPLGAGTNLSKLVTDILNLVIRIGTIVVILVLVYVGFLFVSARGNAAEISNAHRALLWTVIGALILLGAQAISIGIQATVQAFSAGS